MKISLELPTWKCPERNCPQTTLHNSWGNSASTEQYQYQTCLSWQPLPGQFNINTNLLKRFKSRTINTKHIPGMEMLVLQPRSWWVLGGAQPGWLWRPSASPAAGCPSTHLCWPPNLSQNEARKNNSRLAGKRPRRLMDTAGQVSHRLSAAISTEQLGAAQPGNICICYRAAD